jgi:putative transcriptional regulator
MTERTDLGLEIEAGLREAIAHRRGEIALPTRKVDPMPPERVKAIRKTVAKSPKEFEANFGIPARTIEGWEQGRRQPDPAARALLAIIEREPEAARRALSHA